MNEILLLTSSKDTHGVVAVELPTLSVICPPFKSSLSEPNTLCVVAKDSSCYSGVGSSGDYFIVSQAKKPALHVYQWGKSSVHMVCHMQEIITCIESNGNGLLIFGGTKKGWVYCWNLASGILLNSWQAHFGKINKVKVSTNGQFLFSVGDDATAKVWDLSLIIDFSTQSQMKSFKPYRSWNPHTLPIKDMVTIDHFSTLRVLTCSLDKTLVIYDVFSNTTCAKVTFSQSLLCLACNALGDIVSIGSTDGIIYLVDLSLTALSVSAAHAKIGRLEASSMQMDSNPVSKIENSTKSLVGHTRSINSLCFSSDNKTLVSASEDGSIRTWNIWTRQCTKELKPFIKSPVTNAVIICRPEVLHANSGYKPTMRPIAQLKKYPENQNTPNNPMQLNTSNELLNIGTMFLPYSLQIATSMSHEMQSHTTSHEWTKEDHLKATSQVLNSDYISLDDFGSNLVASHSSKIEQNEYKDLFKAAQDKIIELKDSKDKWKVMCEQLKNQLEQAMNTSGAESKSSVVGNKDENLNEMQPPKKTLRIKMKKVGMKKRAKIRSVSSD